MSLKRTLITAIIVLLMASVFTQAGLNVGGSNPQESACDVIFMNSDWTVTAPESYSDEIMVLTGNITVTGSGLLEFTNVTLIMNVTGADGDYGIMVQDGGRFYVNDTDGNSLTTGDRSSIVNNASFGHGYFFQINETSVFEMRNSRLMGCGLFGTQPGANESGPKILSDAMIIQNSEITGCSNGLYIDSANPFIDNCTIDYNVQNGIYYTNATDAYHHFDVQLANNTVHHNSKAGVFLKGNVTDFAMEDNYIHHNGKGGVRINAGYSLNATMENNTVQFNTGKGGIGMYGLPGKCDIRANVSGNNISQNGGVSSLCIGFDYSEAPADTVFLNATANEIWVSGIGEDILGDGLLLVYAQNYIYVNISNNNIIGPLMANGVNIGKVSPEFNMNPSCKVVDALITNNEIVNLKGGALKATSTEELNANVSGNHIYHPTGDMGCSSLGGATLGWYSAETAQSTPKNATLTIKNNLFGGIAAGGAMALKAIYYLDVTIEGNVFHKAGENVGVIGWGFRLGWIDDDDRKLQPSPEGFPTRNVRADIHNNTLLDGSGPAIWVYSSNGTFIHDNLISRRTDGIKIQDTVGNTQVFNNTVGNGSGTGIKVYDSSEVSIFNNTLDNNQYGLGVEYRSKDNIFFNNVITKKNFQYGFYMSTDSFSHVFPANNTVNGVWFRYYHNLQGTPSAHATLIGHDVHEPLMSNLGQFVLVNATYVDIFNSVASNGINGIVLYKSNNTIIRGNTLEYNENDLSSVGSGILLAMGSHNNSMGENNFLDNVYGINFDDSSVDNSAWGNAFSKQSYQTGIFFDNYGTSFRNTVARNNSVDGSPVHYYYDESGIQAINQTVDEPQITNLGQFVVFNSNNVSLNNVTILNGATGLNIMGSDNVTLENSNLSLNTLNLYCMSSTNITLENSKLENGTDSISLSSTSPHIFNSSIGQAVNKAFNLIDGNCHPVLVNSTYNHGQARIFTGSDITVKWFLDVSVMSNSLPCQDVNVTITNVTGAVKYNLSTGSDGLFSGLTLVELVNTSSNLLNLSKYSLVIQKDGFSTYTQDLIMNRSQVIHANLTDIVAPLISATSLEPSLLGTSASYVWLNSSLNDTDLGGSPIAEAEWYISDTVPSILTGTGFPAFALDGAFDETAEDISVQIGIDNWPVGEYKIWIHGRDVWNNWCDWSSAIFTIYDNEGPIATAGPKMDTTVIGISEDQINVITVMDDTGYGNSRIFGVEWMVTQGNDSIINSFSNLAATCVVDGNYDEVNETIESKIDIMFWDIGDYTFQIRGFDEYGNYGYWYTISFKLVDNAAPSAPSNLHAVGTELDISLRWSPNTEIDLAGYNIFRSTTSGSDYVLVATLGAGTITWADEDVVLNDTYFYVITAFDSTVPPNESPCSSEASGMLLEPSASAIAQDSYWWILIPVIVLLIAAIFMLHIKKSTEERKASSKMNNEPDEEEKEKKSQA